MRSLLRSRHAARNAPSMPERTCTRHAAAYAILCALLCAPHVQAQTRKGPAPQAQQDVVRAVSVYEWTGDLAKPTAARVVPVSLFIDHHFEDAGLYLSRPMPLALEPGNIYELESSGVNQGALTLIQAARLHTANLANNFDDGWFGYGTWKPFEAPKPYVPSSLASNAHIISSGEGRPHFTKTPDAPASTAPAPKASSATPPATAPPAPPSTTQSKPSDEPPADPGRPTLHHTAPGDPQRSDSQSSGSQKSDSQSTNTQTADATPPASPTSAPTTSAPASAPAPATPPADQSKPNGSSTGADRPTFSHQQPTDKKKKHTNASASVTDAGGLLADDPGRPHLHHGGAITATALPPLRGLPADMHQRAAVSDAAERPEHNFAYDWTDPTQKAIMLAKLETLARAALPPAAPPPSPKPVHTSAHTRAHKTSPPAPVELLDEELHAYEISYGGVDVFVFTAHTAGEGAALQYVTLLVQPDIYGVPQVLLRSVTNATHMDQTPRMIFIDAVDADGDNRAELLFELRGETQRQFALYRIAQNTATQAFLTGTMQ